MPCNPVKTDITYWAYKKAKYHRQNVEVYRLGYDYQRIFQHQNKETSQTDIMYWTVTGYWHFFRSHFVEP